MICHWPPFGVFYWRQGPTETLIPGKFGSVLTWHVWILVSPGSGFTPLPALALHRSGFKQECWSARIVGKCRHPTAWRRRFGEMACGGCGLSLILDMPIDHWPLSAACWHTHGSHLPADDRYLMLGLWEVCQLIPTCCIVTGQVDIW